MGDVFADAADNEAFRRVPGRPRQRPVRCAGSIQYVPRLTARIRRAAKLEFSSKDRSRKLEAGHLPQVLLFARIDIHPAKSSLSAGTSGLQPKVA
jgi:hypothetical protein